MRVVCATRVGVRGSRATITMGVEVQFSDVMLGSVHAGSFLHLGAFIFVWLLAATIPVGVVVSIVTGDLRFILALAFYGTMRHFFPRGPWESVRQRHLEVPPQGESVFVLDHSRPAMISWHSRSSTSGSAGHLADSLTANCNVGH